MPLDTSFSIDNVSRETKTRLDVYVDQLLKWQSKTNLIGSGTVDDIWRRHILDCWQLAELIGENEDVIDLGSGAGLPGLIIACRQVELGSGSTTMIESNAKKCAFLREAIRCMDFPATQTVRVVNDRVEATLPQIALSSTITARALTCLVDLLGYCSLLETPANRVLFPKGRKYDIEIAEAEDDFVFEHQIVRSKLESDSVIIECRDIRQKSQ